MRSGSERVAHHVGEQHSAMELFPRHNQGGNISQLSDSEKISPSLQRADLWTEIFIEKKMCFRWE